MVKAEKRIWLAQVGRDGLKEKYDRKSRILKLMMIILTLIIQRLPMTMLDWETRLTISYRQLTGMF